VYDGLFQLCRQFLVLVFKVRYFMGKRSNLNLKGRTALKLLRKGKLLLRNKRFNMALMGLGQYLD
jgi:hypothetical protein